MRIPHGHAVLIQALPAGAQVVVEGEHDTLLRVGDHCGGKSSGAQALSVSPCRSEWSSVWMQGVWLRQTRRSGGGSHRWAGAGADDEDDADRDSATSGSQHISIQFSGGGGGFPGWHEEEDAERGYWAGGPVVVRVARQASVFLSGCRLSSDSGTALLAEGEPPGNLPYVVDDTCVEALGSAGMGLDVFTCLLPYCSQQLVSPRLEMRSAFAMLRDCEIGPCWYGHMYAICTLCDFACLNMYVHMYMDTLMNIVYAAGRCRRGWWPVCRDIWTYRERRCMTSVSTVLWLPWVGACMRADARCPLAVRLRGSERLSAV